MRRVRLGSAGSGAGTHAGGTSSIQRGGEGAVARLCRGQSVCEPHAKPGIEAFGHEDETPPQQTDVFASHFRRMCRWEGPRLLPGVGARQCDRGGGRRQLSAGEARRINGAADQRRGGHRHPPRRRPPLRDPGRSHRRRSRRRRGGDRRPGRGGDHPAPRRRGGHGPPTLVDDTAGHPRSVTIRPSRAASRRGMERNGEWLLGSRWTEPARVASSCCRAGSSAWSCSQTT